MYKALFQNSKAALVFAVMTILGAVSMVGTSEDDGLLGRAVDTFEAQRETIASDAAAVAAGQSVSGQNGKAKAAKPSVFSDFTPADEARAKQQQKPSVVAPKGPPPPGHDLMTAPLSSDAVVLDSGQVGVAEITSSEVAITPQ